MQAAIGPRQDSQASTGQLDSTRVNPGLEGIPFDRQQAFRKEDPESLREANTNTRLGTDSSQQWPASSNPLLETDPNSQLGTVPESTDHQLANNPQFLQKGDPNEQTWGLGTHEGKPDIPDPSLSSSNSFPEQNRQQSTSPEPLDHQLGNNPQFAQAENPNDQSWGLGPHEETLDTQDTSLAHSSTDQTTPNLQQMGSGIGPDGGPHCTTFYFTVRPPFYNSNGRRDITDVVNNGRTERGVTFPNIAITVDIQSVAIQSAPGRHFVSLDWVNNLFQRYTVIAERFRPEQHIDNDQPDAAFEINLPAAEPGVVFDNPGRLRRCFDSPPGYKWVLQVRGPT